MWGRAPAPGAAWGARGRGWWAGGGCPAGARAWGPGRPGRGESRPARSHCAARRLRRLRRRSCGAEREEVEPRAAGSGACVRLAGQARRRRRGRPPGRAALRGARPQSARGREMGRGGRRRPRTLRSPEVPQGRAGRGAAGQGRGPGVSRAWRGLAWAGGRSGSARGRGRPREAPDPALLPQGSPLGPRSAPFFSTRSRVPQ